MNRSAALAFAAIALALHAGMAEAKPLPRPLQTRPCVPQDIIGGWKLFRVYARNNTPPMEDFQKNPQQYLYLARNQLVSRLSGTQEYKDAAPLQKAMQKALSISREQYVLDQSGMLFLYQNRVANASLHCGILTKAFTPRIGPGDMALRLQQQGGDVHYIYKRQAMQIKEQAAKTETRPKKK